MDYTYAALAAALFLTGFWAFMFHDSGKSLLTLGVLGAAFAFDAGTHDLPRGAVTGGVFALVILAWIVGFVVVFGRQRRLRRRELT